MKKTNIVILVVTIIILLVLSVILIQNVKKGKREYEIEKVDKYNYFVLREENKYGVIDTSGNKIVQPKYENIIIPNPEKPVFICYEGENTKVLDEKSEEIFTKYKNIEPLRLKNISSDLMYEKNVLKYRKDDKYGIIDLSGKKLTNAIYEEIDTLQFKEGELLVKKAEKYGVINNRGTILVKTNYDNIEVDKFYEAENEYKNSGYIVSKKTEEGYRYGYVNLKGKEEIEVKYNELNRITNIDSKDTYIIYAENGKYGVAKNGENIIENNYQSIIYNESNNTLTALKGRKNGVLSLEGNEIVPFEYKQIDITGKYIYATDADENIKIFETDGKESDIDSSTAIIDIENTNYQIKIKTEDGKTNYNIYKNNMQITKKQYIYIEHLREDYFIACNENGKLGVIDSDERTKIEFNYNSIHEVEDTQMIEAFNNTSKIMEIYSSDMNKICELKNGTLENNDEYIKLYNDSEVKYINKKENEISNIDVFKNNKIFTQKFRGKWGFIDSNGNKVVDYEYDKATEVNKYGFAGIMKDNKWGVIDNEGKIIVEPQYELNDNEPTFIGEYYQVIYGNGEIYYTK
ncbi:MAG: WG repeat-containing protein [Clostridia bacterium]|nr:WG repeat-containing protein [Clostridia bacterium]